MKARQLAVRLLAVSAGVIVALALGELALRLLTPPAQPARRFFGLSDLKSPDFRDRKYDLSQPGGFRILAVGDSFTWGQGVAVAEAYPDRLERQLDEGYPDRGFEVINWSRPGWNTIQQWRSLKSRLSELAPDLVIVGFVLNDAEPAGHEERKSLHGSLRRQLPAGPAGRWLYGHSLLFRRLYQAAENPELRRRVTGYYHDLYREGPDWQTCRRALRRLKQTARKAGAPLVVVVFPVFDSDLDESYAYRRIHATLAATCDELKLRCLDLLPAYAGIEGRRLALDPFIDAHPSALAHEIAADRIRDYLESENLLTRPARRRGP